MEVVTLRGAWPKGTAAAPGRRRRIRLNAAMRERLALVGLVAVSAALRFAAARGVSTPWIAPDWRPHTREQNAAILEGLGLVGRFWALP